MAGLGTVGLEIVTQLPEVDAVLVPAAAGALLAAVLVACKKLKCSCLVYVSILPMDGCYEPYPYLLITI